MPHRTPGLSRRERVLARLGHYAGFTLLFAAVYAGVVRYYGRLPEGLLFGVLGASLLKDLLDEYRLRRGGRPLAYAGVEHAPSNLVLLAMLAAGYVDPAGSFAGISLLRWGLGLAAADLFFDLWQDARA